MKRNNLHKKSLFHSAYGLHSDDTARERIIRSSKGDLSVIQRLGLIDKLDVHTGCVNTINWNETGEYLLSGSDDQHLVIVDAYKHKIIEDFKTPHRANIFSAKFLPCIRDSRIVSCSGDGMLLFTDLMTMDPTYKMFNCHSGTAYEVSTIPLDPHSFLSCGEDGTVRWYDLRIKDRCDKDNCQEDVMIQCQRAVTAMSVNSTASFELAVGCSDSTVRVFDRRMLGTRSTGINFKPSEPLCAFTVPSFKRAYRITSLCFSPEGDEILVSYSSDDLYLFSLRGKGETQLKSSAACPKGKLNLTATAPTPVRRLRLRGDWSDTGPDARPEREAGGRGDISQARPTLHTPLMQHLTNVISRLLNDPATRAALTSGADDAAVAEASQASQEGASGPVDTAAARNDNEDSNSQTSDDQNGAPLGEEADEGSQDLFEEDLRELNLFGESVTSYASLPSTSQNISILSEEDNAIVDCYETPFDFCDSPSPAAVQPQTEYKIAPLRDPDDSSDLNACGSSSGLSTSDIPGPEQNQKEEPIIESNASAWPDSQGLGEVELTNNRNDDAALPTRSVAVYDNDAQDDASTLDTAPMLESARNEGFYSEASIAMYAGVGIQGQNWNTSARRHSAEPGVSLSYSHLGTTQTALPFRNEEVQYVQTLPRSPISAAASPRPLVIDEDAVEPEPGPSTRYFGLSSEPNLGSLFSGGDTEEDDEEVRKELRRITPPGLQCFRSGLENHFPVIRKQYTGHRNARTMIKEATFWGSDYVMSGSDCGHVFIWDRTTAKLVMLLQADHHVVNCIQPHPSEILLATSGIDHDVKLWAPVGEECQFDQELADEIVKRNALMLEETRDTITVPASFMIRMVACLNQIRRGGRRRGDDLQGAQGSEESRETQVSQDE